MHHQQSSRAGLIAILSISMFGMTIAMPVAATASERQPRATADANPSPDLPEVKRHDPSKFASEAASLPMGLKAAIERDLDKSAEEYLAEAEALKDASDLQVELARRGIAVKHAEFVNGTLRLRLASEAQAALVRKAGVEVTVGPADPPKPTVVATPLVANNGTGWAFAPAGSSDGIACSIGFHGFDKSDGQQQFLTAGHCDPGTSPISRFDVASAGNFQAPIVPTTSKPVAGSFRFGSGLDAGLIVTDNSKFVPTDAVDIWEGSTTGHSSVTSLRLRGTIIATVGASLCKSGIRTGWSCGAVTAVNAEVSVSGRMVNSVISCAVGDRGDSGGANVIGQYAVSITSGGGPEPTCPGGKFLTSYPLMSTDHTKSSAMSAFDWEPQVAMYPPTVEGGTGSVRLGTKLSGSVYGGDSNYQLSVYWDGSTTPSQTVVLSAEGRFALDEPTAPGAHSYRLQTRWGSRNVSDVVSGSITVMLGSLYEVKGIQNVGWRSVDTGLPLSPNAMSAANMGANANGPQIMVSQSGSLLRLWSDDLGWHSENTGIPLTATSISAVNMGGTSPRLIAVEGGFLFEITETPTGWTKANTGIPASGAVSAVNMGGNWPQVLLAEAGKLYHIWADQAGWHRAWTGLQVGPNISAVNMGGIWPQVMSVESGVLWQIFADQSGWHKLSTWIPASGRVSAIKIGQTWPTVYLADSGTIFEVTASASEGWRKRSTGVPGGLFSSAVYMGGTWGQIYVIG